MTGARLKAEGVRAGVPDLFLPVAGRRNRGVFRKRPETRAEFFSLIQGRP